MDGELAVENREGAVATLLASHADAIVAALADDGTRIPLPKSFPLGIHQALPLPAERVTMLNVVVAADRIAVAAAWDRARRQGVGVVAVHALSDPDTRLTLTLADVRNRYGVWLGVLTHDDDEHGSQSKVLAGPLIVPSRPRQATMHKSMTAVITDIDENVTRMLGWSRAQMIGARSSDFVHPDDQERAVSTWMQLLSEYGTQRVRLRHLCADGGWLWVEIENIHNGVEAQDEIDVVAHVSDISDEMAAHEALRRSEQQFRRLAEALPTGILQLCHDGSAVYANARFSEIVNTTHAATSASLLAAISSPGEQSAVQSAIEVALERGVDSEHEVELRPQRGRVSRRCSLAVVAVADQNGEPGATICLNDVTESARLREELRFQATHDALTGCLNRAAVMQALEQLLSKGRPDQFAVIFVDVDDFKPVNDHLGHAAGDELLIALAERLRNISRDGDLIARLGGDEFVLVCRGRRLSAHAEAIARRVRDALNGPVSLSSGQIDLRASIGVTWLRPGATAETLIAQADAAMYESKRQRRGDPAHFGGTTKKGSRARASKEAARGGSASNVGNGESD
ncbi:MAG TPA: sensor domain-containing diguanylate cyclase [Solirubrobacteraceae bacterium]|nr:sensor domain-containing diguanylate cyclase [Solirubrobacteraceae bacterium]